MLPQYLFNKYSAFPSQIMNKSTYKQNKEEVNVQVQRKKFFQCPCHMWLLLAVPLPWLSSWQQDQRCSYISPEGSWWTHKRQANCALHTKRPDSISTRRQASINDIEDLASKNAENAKTTEKVVCHHRIQLD